MIKFFNQHIENFLVKESGYSKEDVILIKDKYKTEITDDLKKGHITTNIGLVSGSVTGTNPKEVAEALKKNLINLDGVDQIEVAGPGFLNIFLNRLYFVNLITDSLNAKKAYGTSNLGEGQKIQIEFVSANPTGPLHVGHGRGAAFGDALGRILEASGYKVSKEYYINDAGRQIDILTVSVLLRLFKCFEESSFPSSGYKGKYIVDISNEIDKKDYINENQLKTIISNLPSDPEEEIDALIRNFKNEATELWEHAKNKSLNIVLALIKEDLAAFKVDFNNWFYESSLGTLGDKESKLYSAISQLQESGQAYKDEGALWLNTENVGDDKNRVLIREDGRATYFAADVAYHKDKVDRGFDRLINVWGSDHHGYIKRIESSLEGLGFSKERLHVQLVQFANLFQGKEKIKMSTRSGKFFTLRNLIDEIGVDAARFYYLSKQADQHLDFDIELAKSQNKENLIYYIQYAHARICSLQNKYLELNDSLPTSIKSIEDGAYLSCDKLIHEASKFPGVVQRSAAALQPHLLVFYLRDLAHQFHSFYNDNPVLKESKENQESILQSLNLVRLVIANGLNLLGIDALEKM
tara:strand:- start:2044 stop:3786 length:1743 start_codon:yes stop_codon:yes gene_type:complete